MFLSAFATAAFTEFINILALTIDAIIVCTFLGEREIAAVGLASPFFYLSGIPATALATGLQTLCTQNLGRGQIDSVSRYFNETLAFAACLMALMTAALFFFNRQLAFLFGARGNAADLLELTSGYLHGLTFDAAPFVLSSILTPIVVLDNGNGTVMVSSILGGVTNIVFDIVAVKSGWGLVGVGYASALSAAVSLAVLSTHFFRKNSIIHFRPARLRWQTILSVTKHGLPNTVHAEAGILRSIALNALVAFVGGGVGVSVLAIQNTITDFVDILAVGVAGAVGILSGIAFGEVNGEELKGIGVLAHRYILVISVAVIACLTCFAAPIGRLFLDAGSESWPLLRFAILCVAVSTPFSALIYSRVNYLQAVGIGKKAQRLEAFSNLICLLAFAAAFALLFGVQGVFLAFPASKAAVLAAIYILYARKTNRLRPRARNYLGLDPVFFRQEQDMISYPFATLMDAALSSEQIRLFCNGHGLDERKCILASLCAEEIMKNIVTHSASARFGEPLAELRVTIADNRVILRIKDSGNAFNLSVLAKLLSQRESPHENIGMKLICASTDDISYYRIYRMNTTILKI